MPNRTRAAAATLVLLLASCTVGPDYTGAPVVLPANTSFHRAPEAATIAGPVQAEWWRSLHDPQLDTLIATALANSPNLAEAAARLRQSRAALREQNADLRPTTSASATYLHTHGGQNLLSGFTGGRPDSSASSDADLYDVGFDASWELDLFGGQRRAIEEAAANTGAQSAQFAGARLSLTADVAQSYITLRDLQNRMAIARANAGLQDRILRLTRLRLTGGTASPLDVARLDTQVQSTRAELIPLHAQTEAELDRLAVLTGTLPGTLDSTLAQPAPLPMPPYSVTIGDPAALLRRRPDIVQAERQLAASNAIIGEHVADYFPKVSLFGNLGLASTDLGTLLQGGAFTAVAAPMLSWKAFDFGRTAAKVSQARSARDAAAAHYHAVVLDALQDAETSLSRFGIQRQNVQALASVEASAERADTLTRQRFDGGTATLIDTLDSERTRLQTQQDLAIAKADLTQDFITLQKSLGLGWSAQ